MYAGKTLLRFDHGFRPMRIGHWRFAMNFLKVWCLITILLPIAVFSAETTLTENFIASSEPPALAASLTTCTKNSPVGAVPAGLPGPGQPGFWNQEPCERLSLNELSSAFTFYVEAEFSTSLYRPLCVGTAQAIQACIDALEAADVAILESVRYVTEARALIASLRYITMQALAMAEQLQLGQAAPPNLVDFNLLVLLVSTAERLTEIADDRTLRATMALFAARNVLEPFLVLRPAYNKVNEILYAIGIWNSDVGALFNCYKALTIDICKLAAKGAAIRLWLMQLGIGGGAGAAPASISSPLPVTMYYGIVRPRAREQAIANRIIVDFEAMPSWMDDLTLVVYPLGSGALSGRSFRMAAFGLMDPPLGGRMAYDVWGPNLITLLPEIIVPAGTLYAAILPPPGFLHYERTDQYGRPLDDLITTCNSTTPSLSPPWGGPHCPLSIDITRDRSGEEIEATWWFPVGPGIPDLQTSAILVSTGFLITFRARSVTLLSQ